MKVMLVNGSSHLHGTTMAALEEMIKVFHSEEVETEVVQLGGKPIADCLQCNVCQKTGKCVIKDDGVNEFVEKREKSYEERILRDIQNGIIIETLMAKKHKKTPEEKAAVAKQKKQQRRARRKQETRDNLAKEEILQDDRFFVIAGYTSGGAPYGVTWEEMGLKPWEDLEENN